MRRRRMRSRLRGIPRRLRALALGLLAAIALAGAGLAGMLLLRRRRPLPPQTQAPLRAAPRPLPFSAAPAEPPANPPHTPDEADTGPKWLVPTRLKLGLALLPALLILGVGADLLFRGARRFPAGSPWHVPGGDPQRGRQAIFHHGCGGCHVIPGVPRARGRVGPQLDDLREQTFLAGRLPNLPQNLVLWIQNPKEVDPQTAMPDLNVSEDDARDIAAYLYTR